MATLNTMIDVIEKYYVENHSMLVKRFTRPAGTVWNAEDVVQTAFERALKYHHTYNPEQVFSTWFTALLRNALIDKLNEERGIVYEDFNEFDWEAPSTIDYDQTMRMIEEMIEEENPDHQPILDLHFLKGYTAKDIYEFNKMSYPNTRKIIQRFRDKVKKRIDGD